MGGSYFIVWWSWEGIKGESQGSIQLHGEGQRDLYMDNLFPEIMRLIYWVKVNTSMIIFMDHCWSLPFHDKHFQCNLLSCIIAFHVWAWFLVRTGKVCQSLEDIPTCHSLKSSFNHYWMSLSHCLIMLSIQFVHDLSSGFIPYIIHLIGSSWKYPCDWYSDCP